MQTPEQDAVSERVHQAWSTLDDALQILVRAESLVMLLRCAVDVEEHHRYSAEIACEQLTQLKAKLSEALAQVRIKTASPTGPIRRGAKPKGITGLEELSK